MQVLASVLGCIKRPQDVFAIASASKNLRGIARQAALRLRIASPRAYPHSVPGDLELKVRVTLHGVMHAFKGIHVAHKCCPAITQTVASVVIKWYTVSLEPSAYLVRTACAVC